MKSIVKCFKDEKGYGFIEYKGNDILINYCAFREQVKEEMVEIEYAKTDNGYEMKNILQTEEVG